MVFCSLIASNAIRAFMSALKLRRCLDFIPAPFPRPRFYTLLTGPNLGEHLRRSPIIMCGLFQKERGGTSGATLGRRPLTHYSLSRYSPGTSSCGTSCVRTSPSSASPASSTPFTTSASNAFPSSSSSSTLSESAPWTLDNPCKSPDCSPDRAPCPSSANATASTLWLFPRTCSLSAPAVFPPVVFLPPTFFFPPAFCGAPFFSPIFFLVFFFFF